MKRQRVCGTNRKSQVNVEMGREELDMPHRPGASQGISATWVAQSVRCPTLGFS